MGGKCSSNRTSTTLPRTEVTAPKLVVFFMFAFADPHLRHPSRHCIRHGVHPGCTGHGDRELGARPHNDSGMASRGRRSCWSAGAYCQTPERPLILHSVLG